MINSYQYLPPHNILAEKMLVSVMMVQHSKYLLKQTEKLSPDFFYFKSNSLLYKALLEVINQIEKINLNNLLIALETKNIVKQLGGLETILGLIDSSPVADIIDECSTIVVDNYIKRLLLESSNSLSIISCSKQPITQNKITSIVNQLTIAYEILEDSETPTLAKTFAKLLVNLDTTKKASISNEIFSGFLQLDLMTNGFQKSDLIIIAGRPSMGKTAFAINITRHIVKTSKSSVMLFSLEMSTEQLLRRILAQECYLNSQRIQSGQLTSTEWQNVVNESKILSHSNLYIDDSASISSEIIRTKIKFLKLQGHEIDLIIIDYLQLLQDPRQSENRSQELSFITRSLKILAKELNLPILVLSQLNRNLESRSNKRPLLSDLRESGCISKFSYIKLNNVNQPLFSFSHNQFRLDNFAQQFFHLFTQSKSFISKPNKKTTYKIVTRSNKYLELTNNHKILTLHGWRRCDKLTNNDMIATQIQLRLSKNEKYFFNCFPSLSLNFESLRSINIDKMQTVFDFVVNPLHNFIANNIVVHNSIEQDADLVIMLYRESYYDKEAPTEDLTEVIIAKHRNGPVGTFQLRFDANLANFLNI